MIALAGLAAGLAVSGEAEAQSSTDPFWTATMTVGVLTSGQILGYALGSSGYGSISPSDDVMRAGYPDVETSFDWNSGTKQLQQVMAFGTGMPRKGPATSSCASMKRSTLGKTPIRREE